MAPSTRAMSRATEVSHDRDARLSHYPTIPPRDENEVATTELVRRLIDGPVQGLCFETDSQHANELRARVHVLNVVAVRYLPSRMTIDWTSSRPAVMSYW
jgi:hypothetical protein